MYSTWIFKTLAVILLSYLTLATSTSNADDALIPLTDQDLPRSALGEMGLRLSEPGFFGTGPPFVFPEDAKPEYLYGIDVSHYNFTNGRKIDWQALPSKSVHFVYIKATQGAKYFDDTFAKSWSDSRLTNSAALRRGAYHFLSADADPEAQAKTFIQVLTKSNYTAGADLPPAVDLEWDCTTGPTGKVLRDDKGNCLGDKWSKYSSDQIVQKASVWLNKVEHEIGVRPVVYTNAQWWKSVGLGDNQFLLGQPLWIADYSPKSQQAGRPRTPAGYASIMWQFTDNAKIEPTCLPSDRRSPCTDSSVVFMEQKAFLKLMGVK
jgi:lysozyme